MRHSNTLLWAFLLGQPLFIVIICLPHCLLVGIDRVISKRSGRGARVRRALIKTQDVTVWKSICQFSSLSQCSVSLRVCSSPTSSIDVAYLLLKDFDLISLQSINHRCVLITRHGTWMAGVRGRLVECEGMGDITSWMPTYKSRELSRPSWLWEINWRGWDSHVLS